MLPLLSRSVVSDCFGTPWLVAHQAPLSMGFSRQEYWSGLPFPSLGDLPDPEFRLASPALTGGFLPVEPYSVRNALCFKEPKMQCLQVFINDHSLSTSIFSTSHFYPWSFGFLPRGCRMTAVFAASGPLTRQEGGRPKGNSDTLYFRRLCHLLENQSL